jgi:FKBP-type peptidyl-prolyl cis-trans isomerase
MGAKGLERHMKHIAAVAVSVLLATPALAAPAVRPAPATPAAARPAAPAAPAPAAADPLSREANAAFLAAYAQKKGVIKKSDGLMFRILRNGFGARPNPTDTVKVYYTGRLINDAMFDGTSPGLPAFFKVTDVIPGWIEALEMMRVGDQWEIVIPPQLGYGSHGSGQAIPPDQALVFNVTLLQTIPLPKKGDKDYRPDPDDKDDQ